MHTWQILYKNGTITTMQASTWFERPENQYFQIVFFGPSDQKCGACRAEGILEIQRIDDGN